MEEKNILNGFEYANSFCVPSTEANEDSNNDKEMTDLSSSLKNMHFNIIKAIENDDSLDRNEKNEKKISILEKYVHNLQAENDTFISIMTELEKEASERVKQMDKRLKSSARSTMEAVINVHHCESVMKKIVNEKLYLESLFDDMQSNFSAIKVENSFLRDQNFNLNHDVQALLHIIQNARSTGHWEMSCVTFCEVTPEQVFGPVQSISNVYKSDSSQLACDSPEKYNKIYNNSIVDQKSRSNSSSPSVAPHCVRTNSRRACHNKAFKKDKKIPLLKHCIIKLRQQLAIKEAECEYHLRKIRQFTQEKQGQQYSSPPNKNPHDTILMNCFSLPDIGNIYSYLPTIRKSHSLKAIPSNFDVKMKSPRNCAPNQDETGEAYQNHKSIIKNNYPLHVHKSQSEPHLFMFGDNIYVYRPCESKSNTSDFALNDSDIVLPCQSIDLKFPTDESPKTYDWSFLSKHRSNLTSCSTYYKEPVSSSCSCFDVEEEKINVDSESKTSTSFSQTEKVSKASISSQTSVLCEMLNEVYGDTKKQISISEMINVIKVLKENLVKEENKVEEKNILIEQLQGHITSSVKEVELKDKVLENIEKKLNLSRNECSSLKQKVNEIMSELSNSQSMSNNLQEKFNSKEEEIQQILTDQKSLQEQKRSLLTQLDVQGDMLENQRNELEALRNKSESFALQNEQQSYIIKNLQDALVKSKRALDAKMPSFPMQSPQSDNKNASRSSIVDI